MDLIGIEPMTSSMPWNLQKRKGNNILDAQYADHMALTARVQAQSQKISTAEQSKKDAVQAVTSSLGSELAKEKEDCAKLEGANGALNKQTADQQETINHCQEDAIKLLMPEAQKTTVLFFDKDESKTPAVARFLLLTNKAVTPVAMNIGCNWSLESASISPIGGGVYLGSGGARLNANTWLINMSSPAWTPIAPLIATVSYYHGGDVTCSFQLR